MKEKKLGRGLGALLAESEKQVEIVPPKKVSRSSMSPKPVPVQIASSLPPATSTSSENLTMVRVSEIIPNRFQPRQEFLQESLDELISSIKSTGVLQPILARKIDRGYELVAGERRWRACKALKMDKIAAVIKENISDREMLEWALVENTQRKDLNPIERARGYRQLSDTFELSQEAIAEKAGLDRSTIANFIRLLDLPGEIQADVSRGTISMGHARALLSLDKKQDQLKLAKRIKQDGISVRKLEHIIAQTKQVVTKSQKASSQEDLYIKELEARLRRRFGSKVTITRYKKRGCVTIEFYSNDDFQRILEILSPS